MAVTGLKTTARPPADFPFESRYVTVEGYRIHYVEEGSREPVLFIHGNPTSSYIWRNILPKVARETGRRCLALDLLGFGKSAKPDVDYSLSLHARIVAGFIDGLGLKNLVLVLQDWGGPLGMHYAVRNPRNIAGVALMETMLWDWTWKDFGPLAPVFRLFRSPAGYLMIQVMNFFVNRLLPASVVNKNNLTKEVMQRYRKPFPTVKSRRAIRKFPQLIPVEGKPRESFEFINEINEKLARVTSPALWIKATPGAILREETAYRLLVLKEKLPQLVVRYFGPGLHYLQEDDPEKIVRLLVNWMREYGLVGREEKGAASGGREAA